jgi:cell division transport system permease protein
MKPVNKKKNTRPNKTFKSELKRRFDMWWLQHLQAFIFSLGQYIRYPLSLIKELEAMPEVDNAQYDSQWIKRLVYLLDIVNRLIIILSTLLAIGVLLIVGNTIRLSIYNRRAEIEITKLFGGTDSFIQRPFLYSGLWYGAFGGIIAWVLITVSMQMLRGPVKQLANLYASDFQLIGLGFLNSLLLVGIGIALGLFGSWISVKRHLKAIDPV